MASKAITKVSLDVGKIAMLVALISLQVFWYIPLMLLSVLFGPKFSNILAAVVSPRSVKSKSTEDEE